jgi:MFS family permease
MSSPGATSGNTASAQPNVSDSAYGVLKIPDFRLYLIARFIASLGQQMLTVAVDWEIYERTNSKLALGMVGLTQMIPMFLFTLPAGHLADNFDRKRIIMGMTGVMAICSLGLALVSGLNGPVFWMYICLFIAGAARTFMWPASAAFLPQIISRKNFPRAVNWSSSTFHLSSVLGPTVCGVLIAAVGHAMIIYLLNGLAAFACFVFYFFIRAQHEVLKKEKMSVNSFVTGFKFVYSNKIIFSTITLDLFAVLLGGATVLFPVYAKDILHVGVQGLGILRSALPVGSLVCAMMLAHLPPIQKAGRTLLWSVIGFGVATIVFGLSKDFWLSFVMLFICGATDNVSIVVRHTLVQMLTPDEKRGRVSAVNSLFIGTSNELGGFESGTVAHFFGPVFSVVSGGIGTIIVVLVVGWIWPEMRNYGRLDQIPPPPSTNSGGKT